MNKWQDPNLSLGERCVEFSKNEMAKGVKEDKLNSFTSPRIREYFQICTRLVNGKETPIGKTFTAGNWCAASASFAMHESLLPGEVPSHGYRLGVVEVVADMQKLGTYYTKAQARSGEYKLKVGDVIIFDRSTPGKPATQWYRHIGRVYTVGEGGKFTCISGNNGGQWKISNHDLNQAKLLGFGSYPALKEVPQTTPVVSPPIDWDQAKIEELVPMVDTGKDLGTSPFYSIINRIFGK